MALLTQMMNLDWNIGGPSVWASDVVRLIFPLAYVIKATFRATFLTSLKLSR